jgi:uncharacterized protein with PQ loop repeat
MNQVITLSSVVSFVILFFGLFCVIYLGIIIFNIYRNSYNPNETLLILLAIIGLFIVNLIFLFFSISRLVESLQEFFSYF